MDPKSFIREILDPCKNRPQHHTPQGFAIFFSWLHQIYKHNLDPHGIQPFSEETQWLTVSLAEILRDRYLDK